MRSRSFSTDVRPHPPTWFLNECISSLTLCIMTFDSEGRSPSLQVLSLRSKFPMDFMICTSQSTMHCPLMVQPNKAGKGGNIEVPSIISSPFKKYDMKNCLCVCIYIYIHTTFLYNSHLKVAMALKELEHTGPLVMTQLRVLTAVLVTWSHTWQNCMHVRTRAHTCTHTHTHTLSLSLQV